MIKRYFSVRRPRIGDRPSERGYSIIELLIAFAIIAVLTTISIQYFFAYARRYTSDDQARFAMDLMSEAGQLAMTRRRTIRLEIDSTENKIHLIDENGSAPDTSIKSIPLAEVGDVRVNAAPSGIARPNPPNYNDAVFADDTIGHQKGSTQVIGNWVWAARFKSDGTVVNVGNIPISATLYFWPPQDPGNNIPRNIDEIRAVTIFGGSGAVRFWKYNGSAFIAE